MCRGCVLLTVLVALCAGGCGSSAPSVPTSETTVHGLVIDATTSVPVPNVSVWIGSAHASTDINGEFVLPNVGPTYDLVVSSGPGSDRRIAIARGLTRRDPVAQVFFQANWTRQASLALTLSGSGTTADPAVAWGGSTSSYLGLRARNGTRLDTDLFWYGPETTQGTVHVLTFSAAVPFGMPSSYGGYGSLMATVSSAAGGAPGGGPVELSPVPTLSLTSTVAEIPDGYVLNFQALSLVFSDGARFDLGNEGINGGTTFTDLVPVLPSSSIELSAVAGRQGDGSASVVRWTGATVASPVFRFRQPPTLLAPGNWPTDLSLSSEFSWASSTPGASELAVFCQSTDLSTFLEIHVVTGGNSVRLPDPAAFGSSYPPGAMCSWSVIRRSQLSDVDSYLGVATIPVLPSSQTLEVSDSRWFYPP